MSREDWEGENNEARKIEKKKRKQIREQDASLHLLMWSKRYGAKYEHIADYQLRVSLGNVCIDIFPQSKKVFNIPLKKWSTYKKLSSLLITTFQTVAP